MTDILVAGGAGYIGSHTCLDLFNKGFTPIVYDNLSNGHPDFVKWGPFEQGDIRDRRRPDEVPRKHRPAAIIHFAAAIEVGESIRDPNAYYDNNVSGTITLLRAAQAAGIDKLVFSSTCATYGAPESVPISERHRQRAHPRELALQWDKVVSALISTGDKIVLTLRVAVEIESEEGVTPYNNIGAKWRCRSRSAAQFVAGSGTLVQAFYVKFSRSCVGCLQPVSRSAARTMIAFVHSLAI